MTVPNKPLLATLYPTDPSRLTAVIACPNNIRPSRLFKHKKLAALIASTILLHACSTLPANAPEEAVIVTQSERAAITQSRANAMRQSRSIASPVWELDDIRDGIETPAHEQTVWFRVSQGIGFALEHHNDDIQGQIDWFSNNPDYMLQVTDRSAPFIYEIVAEIERRNLPLELALLPVIESAYNPNARSSANAAGLWQFMAATATTFGLKRDWWYDGRNDPIASTNAALDYLERLNAQFGGDWLLTLAAYNAGEGTVLRAIERNQRRDRPTDFWSLPLPAETQRHIPRLLGLAHVMADPETFGVSLSQIPNQPYLAAVDVGSQIDLTLVANLADLDPDMVFRLNPGYLQWATHPDGPHTVWLPADKLDVFESNFANMATSPITWDRYVIKSGDTLGAIARAHNTQVPVLQQVNNLSDSRIVAGQTLLIPRAYRDGDPLPVPNTLLAAANTQPVPSTAYQVRSGDSLWAIANRYKLSIDELATWNNIDPSAVLRPGQSLRMQPQVTLAANDTPSSASAADQALDSATQYQVRRGDTLAKIAREHNVTVREITEWNRIQANSIIRPGQELIVRRNP
ncbi:MAG: LysM peptidoglycan-binding domain-containing protein [Pseudohongiella sp.]|nr:LysM peptidoglycan-binding domain-containing protein [Pseudohongiella sp.]